MTIPTKFECMGSTITTSIEALPDKGDDGTYHSQEQKISVSTELTPQAQEQTFWHEFMHCALQHLGYAKLDNNEQFVDQMAQCLYQLQKTRVDRKRK